MGRPPAVGDKHRPVQGRLLGSACVLVKLPAGKGGDGHGMAHSVGSGIVVEPWMASLLMLHQQRFCSNISTKTAIRLYQKVV